MTEENLFPLFHLYRRAVRRGLVQPLKCKTCSNELIMGMDENDELILHCPFCDSDLHPGLGMIGDVRAVVKEHFTYDE